MVQKEKADGAKITPAAREEEKKYSTTGAQMSVGERETALIGNSSIKRLKKSVLKQ